MTALDPITAGAGVFAFVAECCVTNSGSGRTSELYNAYLSFCRRHNRMAASRERFFELLADRGYTQQTNWVRSLKVSDSYRVAETPKESDAFATPVTGFLKQMELKGVKLRAEDGRITVWRSNALTGEDRAYMKSQRVEIARVLSENLVARAANLLPSWFVPHMVEKGKYGLLLASGQMFPIGQILDVEASADGGVWLDVVWLDAWDAQGNRHPRTTGIEVTHVVWAPEGGSETSFNAASIAAALDFSPTRRGELF